MSVGHDSSDPKGLVRESFRIEGITPGECRTIFLDWALSLPEGVDPAAASQALLYLYGPGNAGHPMVAVLTESAARPALRPARRGGGRARRPADGPPR